LLNSRKALIPALMAAGAAACQPVPSARSAEADLTDERRMELAAFAQQACGDCHAVEPNALSPNRDAPPFPSIVNHEGLTRDTLATWLRDAHNYPREMDFEIGPDEVDDLVTYMLTLQDEDYEPPIY
jgi:mono/diheme cytochrome c family protein